MSTSQAVRQILKHFITPEQYDFWARELGSTTAWQRCFARIVDRREETRDTVTLILKPNAHFPGYRAGQHVNISTSIRGRRITRCYSLTSIPEDGDLLSITVRRDRQGALSPWLCSSTRIGDMVEISGVFGQMTLDTLRPGPDDTWWMLAAGSGITPLYSLIRARLRSGHPGNIRLLYWDHDAGSFCFRQELEKLSGLYPQFDVTFIGTRIHDTETPIAGRLSAAQLDTLLNELALPAASHRPMALVCGGSGFVETASKLLQGRVRQCYSESFTPAAAVEEATQKTVTVELLASGKTLSVSNQRTLLDSLEAEGIAVESGCRMGICNTCVCHSPQGRTRDISTGLVNHSKSTRLCISRPLEDMQIDL